MELRVCENPAGEILIAVATPERWGAAAIPAWEGVEVINSLSMTEQHALKLVRPLIEYYEDLGHEVIWPMRNGQFRAMDWTTREILAVGTYRQVTEATNIDRRSCYRSQITLGLRVKSRNKGRRALRFEPIYAE